MDVRWVRLEHRVKLTLTVRTTHLKHVLVEGVDAATDACVLLRPRTRAQVDVRAEQVEL